MVTLSSVGYGAQYYPQSPFEMIIGLFLMLFGTLVFARFLDKYKYVYETLYVSHDKETKLEDLTHWIEQLYKFRDKSLPRVLHKQILDHFAFFLGK